MTEEGSPGAGAAGSASVVARLASLEARVRALEDRAGTFAGEPAAQPPPPAPGAVPLPPPPMPTPVIADPRPAGSRPQRRPGETNLTGEAALKWSGLGLVFLAAAFLVSTAISRGWIGPELQLAGAVALGVALIGAGLRPLPAIRGWEPSLVIVGLAVLFTSSGASSEWLDLVDPIVAAVAAMVVAVGGVALARHLDQQWVALTTLVAIFTVAIWVGAPEGLALQVGLTLVAVVVMHALHIERSWPGLFAATVALTALVQLGSAGAADGDGSATVAIIITLLVLTACAHWSTPALHDRRHVVSPDSVAQLSGRVLIGVPSWLWAAIEVHQDLGDNAASVLAFGIALGAALSAVALWSVLPRWLAATQLLGAFVVAAIGFAFWLDGSALLAALAVQALALLALGQVVDDEWFTLQSIVTAVLVLMATGGLTLDAVSNDVGWGADAVHFGVFAATGLIGARLWNRPEGRALVLVAYGGLLLWVGSVFVHVTQGQVIISVIWAGIGLGVVVVALGRRLLDVARVGLLTLALVVGKLLTVDLAAVDTIWRAGLFFVIGLGFLWLSSSIPGLLGIGAPRPDEAEADDSDSGTPVPPDAPR